MKELLLSFALFLHRSPKYKVAKQFAKDILFDANNTYKRYFDLTIIFLVISSVLILIYEVKRDVHDALNIFNSYVISFIFFIEYMFRLWIIAVFQK